MGDFAARLARLRRGAGFPTAYRFYHGNGGRRHFPFTYVHYLRIERGAKLPRPEWLPRFVSALRLSPGQAGAREFFTSYLKGLLRTPEAFELASAALKGAGGGTAPRSAAALGWLKSQHSFHLDPGQFKVLAGSEPAYWCSEALFNEEGSLTAAEIAQAFGMTEREAKAGLERLRAAGMARRTERGRFRSRWPGKFFTFPGRLEGMAADLAAVQGFWERMFRKKGRPFAERVELVRAEEASVRAYAVSLGEALDAANGYAVHAKGEGTGLFLIEARVRKLLDY